MFRLVRAHAVEVCGYCAAHYISSSSSNSDVPLRSLMVIIRVTRDARVECRRLFSRALLRDCFSLLKLCLGAAVASLAHVVASFSEHSSSCMSKSRLKEGRLMPPDEKQRCTQVFVMELDMTMTILIMMFFVAAEFVVIFTTLILSSFSGCVAGTHRRRYVLEKH
jgi:hypothetical protein